MRDCNWSPGFGSYSAVEKSNRKGAFFTSVLAHAVAALALILVGGATGVLDVKPHLPGRDAVITLAPPPEREAAMPEPRSDPPPHIQAPLLREPVLALRPPPEKPTPFKVASIPSPPVVATDPIRPVPKLPQPIYPPPPDPVRTGVFGAAGPAANSTPRPTIQVGGFTGGAANSAVTREVAATTGAFGDAKAVTPQARPSAPASTGGFGQATASPAERRSATEYATAGFGDARSGTAAAPRAGGVASTGAFGDARSGMTATPRSAPSRTGAFGDAVVVEPAKQTASTAEERQAAGGITVLEKPRPVYTEEARRLKIEGEVWLEVLFSASGSVRVIRVVKGLGHGLDENASLAAEKIRFRPALRGNAPVDTVAIARITFQLAY